MSKSIKYDDTTARISSQGLHKSIAKVKVIETFQLILSDVELLETQKWSPNSSSAEGAPASEDLCQIAPLGDNVTD